MKKFKISSLIPNKDLRRDLKFDSIKFLEFTLKVSKRRLLIVMMILRKLWQKEIKTDQLEQHL